MSLNVVDMSLCFVFAFTILYIYALLTTAVVISSLKIIDSDEC